MSTQENNREFLYLLKSLKEKHVEDTMKKGRFCFNHPSIFNKWENSASAQSDRHDSHSAYDAIDIFFAPIIGEKDGVPQYGEVKRLADKGIIRLQDNRVKHSPICCFRLVEKNEITVEEGAICYSLGETAKRIKNEFGHDSFVLIQAKPFLERVRKQYSCSTGSVVYRDTLNGYDFDVPDQCKEVVEQLYRKDERFAWQKEYRIVLPPTEETPVFIELGSIEDIAISGSMDDLI